MPWRKSVINLEELCWKVAIEQLKTIQYQAKYLPTHFINELYKRSSVYKDNVNSKLFLPADLFLNPKTTELFNLKFDLPPEDLYQKILRDCKNLRGIALLSGTLCMTSDSLTAIITNNSLLLHLNLHYCNFTDHHLHLIGKHCPRLQHLNLEQVSLITDQCVDYLPTTLTFLNINFTNITPTGALKVLHRLKSLRELKYNQWITVLNLLRKQPRGKAIFPIESLEIRKNPRPIGFNFGKIISDNLPKLVNIRFIGTTNVRDLNSVEYYKKENLIKHVDLNFVPDIIEICQQFPMLESLSVRSNVNNWANIPSMKPMKIVPMKHLRNLELQIDFSGLPMNYFKAFLEHFYYLQSLVIMGWRRLGDREIYDLLTTGLLQRLEIIKFEFCYPFTATAMIKLLESIDNLKFLGLFCCQNIFDAECYTLENVIKENNWDVNLSIDK